MNKSGIWFSQIILFSLISNNIFRGNYLRVFIFLTALIIINIFIELFIELKNNTFKINFKTLILALVGAVTFIYTVYYWIIFLYENKV